MISAIGASYASVSFLRSLFAAVDCNDRRWMIGFIVGSAGVSVFIEKTVALLIVAGTINGLVLPLALGIHSAGRSQEKRGGSR